MALPKHHSRLDVKLLFDLAAPSAICALCSRGSILRREVERPCAGGETFPKWRLWSVHLSYVATDRVWMAPNGIVLPPARSENISAPGSAGVEG